MDAGKLLAVAGDLMELGDGFEGAMREVQAALLAGDRRRAVRAWGRGRRLLAGMTAKAGAVDVPPAEADAGTN